MCFRRPGPQRTIGIAEAAAVGGISSPVFSSNACGDSRAVFRFRGIDCGNSYPKAAILTPWMLLSSRFLL